MARFASGTQAAASVSACTTTRVLRINSNLCYALRLTLCLLSPRIEPVMCISVVPRVFLQAPQLAAPAPVIFSRQIFMTGQELQVPVRLGDQDSCHLARFSQSLPSESGFAVPVAGGVQTPASLEETVTQLEAEIEQWKAVVHTALDRKAQQLAEVLK
eukprot:m.95392 g.95392  ORF g.95392 m.95392 type:complete len:158 (-) comp8748_c0_seq1:62-535(-)